VSWIGKFYGSERPKFLRALIFSIFYISIILWFYGWWADFTPSSEWKVFGVYVSIFISAIYCPVFYLLATTQKPIIKIFKSYIGRIFQFLFIAVLMTFVFWGVVVHGAADLLTQVIGKPTTIESELSKTYSASRRSCDFRLEGDAIREAMPSYICISEPLYSELPAQQIFKLEGKRSYLGFHIKKIDTE
jgi:hypothetical protein